MSLRGARQNSDTLVPETLISETCAPITMDPEIVESSVADEQVLRDSRERQAEHLRLLWEHRRLLLRAAAIGLLAATIVAFLIPKQYTSTTQLMPPDAQSSSGLAMLSALAAQGGGNSLGAVAGDLLGAKTTGSLFLGVLKSETSEDGLIQEFDLQKVYGTRLLIDARTKFDANTSMSEDKKSGIITISVTDHSPQRAADLANAYVNRLNSMMTDLSTSAAHRERVFLEERLKVVKQDLDDASNQLAQFSSKNNTLDMELEGKAMLDVTSNLAGQLVAAQSQLEGLRQIYTDNNSRVQSLNARVAELRKQLQKLSGADDTSAPNTAATASSAVAADATATPFPTIHNLPLLGAKYEDYYRHAKIQETVYELLTEQYELAKVQEAKETPSVKVLDPARVPERKSAPHRLSIMLVGTFSALCLALAWVIGSSYWQQSDPQDPRKILVQEIAATVKARMPWAPQSREVFRPNPSMIESGRHGRRPPMNGDYS